MLNNKEQYDFQEYLKKKQIWIQKAIKEIQNGNIKTAIQCINLDAGFNIEMVKILETILPKEPVKEPEPVEIDTTDESTYEDVNTEEEK
jgi:hypothetical protein